jgi:LPXTG-motif cell wall-anchored protein
MMGSENKKGSKNMNDLYTMGGLVALTLAFAFVSRRK